MTAAPSPREVVRSALDAVRVVGLARFAWFDELHDILPESLAPLLSPAEVHRQLTGALAAFLYERCYVQGCATRRGLPGGPPTSASRHDWVAALESAAPEGEVWEAGWTVDTMEPETALIHKAGLVLRAPLSKIRGVDPSESGGSGEPLLSPGRRVDLAQPRVRSHVAPGFVLVRGSRELSIDQPVLRLYWNVDPEGALLLLGLAPERLDGARSPWVIKIVAEPTALGRCDTAVLYAPRADWDALAAVLTPVVGTLAPHRRAGIPAFVRPLARGMGVADDPPDGSSFGVSRCRLLAMGIVEADLAGASPIADRLRAVEAAFATAGIDLDAPHLGPGSRELADPSWAEAPW